MAAMNCKICSAPTTTALTHTVRGKHEARYALCPSCDLMFVENPTWLAEAYEKPINVTDVGYVTRNVFLSRKTLLLCYIAFGKNGTYVDYAAGYGMLVRLMRDYGINFLWDDPYTTNLFSQGFEYDRAKKITAITCFECFEHLPDPLDEMKKMLAISDTIIFSTRLKPVGEIPELDWPYYGFEHGQHVAFWSKKSLARLAADFSLNFYTDGDNFHIITKRTLPKGIMKMVNLMTKLQFDLVVRKLLTSKTTADHELMIERTNHENSR